MKKMVFFETIIPTTLSVISPSAKMTQLQFMHNLLE